MKKYFFQSKLFVVYLFFAVVASSSTSSPNGWLIWTAYANTPNKEILAVDGIALNQCASNYDQSNKDRTVFLFASKYSCSISENTMTRTFYKDPDCLVPDGTVLKLNNVQAVGIPYQSSRPYQPVPADFTNTFVCAENQIEMPIPPGINFAINITYNTRHDCVSEDMAAFAAQREGTCFYGKNIAGNAGNIHVLFSLPRINYYRDECLTWWYSDTMVVNQCRVPTAANYFVSVNGKTNRRLGGPDEDSEEESSENLGLDRGSDRIHETAYIMSPLETLNSLTTPKEIITLISDAAMKASAEKLVETVVQKSETTPSDREPKYRQLTSEDYIYSADDTKDDDLFDDDWILGDERNQDDDYVPVVRYQNPNQLFSKWRRVHVSYPTFAPSPGPGETYKPTVKPTYAPTPQPTSEQVFTCTVKQELIGITATSYLSSLKENNIVFSKAVASLLGMKTTTVKVLSVIDVEEEASPSAAAVARSPSSSSSGSSLSRSVATRLHVVLRNLASSVYTTLFVNTLGVSGRVLVTYRLTYNLVEVKVPYGVDPDTAHNYIKATLTRTITAGGFKATLKHYASLRHNSTGMVVVSPSSMLDMSSYTSVSPDPNADEAQLNIAMIATVVFVFAMLFASYGYFCRKSAQVQPNNGILVNVTEYLPAPPQPKPKQIVKLTTKNLEKHRYICDHSSEHSFDTDGIGMAMVRFIGPHGLPKVADFSNFLEVFDENEDECWYDNQERMELRVYGQPKSNNYTHNNANNNNNINNNNVVVEEGVGEVELFSPEKMVEIHDILTQVHRRQNEISRENAARQQQQQQIQQHRSYGSNNDHLFGAYARSNNYATNNYPPSSNAVSTINCDMNNDFPIDHNNTYNDTYNNTQQPTPTNNHYSAEHMQTHGHYATDSDILWYNTPDYARALQLQIQEEDLNHFNLE